MTSSSSSSNIPPSLPPVPPAQLNGHGRPAGKNGTAGGAASGSGPATAPAMSAQELRDIALVERTLEAPVRWIRPVAAVTLFALIGCGLFLSSYLPRVKAAEELTGAAQKRASAALRIQAATAKAGAPITSVNIPSTLRPVKQASLYAQIAGYVKAIKHDIGDQVSAGDVLAEIDVPVLREQINAAKADLLAAEARVTEVQRKGVLAGVLLARGESLLAKNAVSAQELDQLRAERDVSAASTAAAQAAVASRQAEIDRLLAQLEYSQMKAPFDGTVTRRAVEVGDYVSVGLTGSGASSIIGSGAGNGLFSIAQTGTLKLLLDVPQRYTSLVKQGQPVDIALANASAPVQGTVTRLSGALDEVTRTMSVEVTVDNASGALLPGVYAEAKLKLPRMGTPVVVPGVAITLRGSQTFVGILQADKTIKYVPVTINRDLGTEVEILDGLTVGDRVVINQPDEVPAGRQVEVAEGGGEAKTAK